jgi:hypothetical protein
MRDAVFKLTSYTSEAYPFGMHVAGGRGLTLAGPEQALGEFLSIHISIGMTKKSGGFGHSDSWNFLLRDCKARGKRRQMSSYIDIYIDMQKSSIFI